jgi:hypothetical protein
MLWPKLCIEDPTPDIPCGASHLQFRPHLVQPLKYGEVVACREFHSAGRKRVKPEIGTAAERLIG